MLITTLCTETSFLCLRRASLTKKKREKGPALRQEANDHVSLPQAARIRVRACERGGCVQRKRGQCVGRVGFRYVFSRRLSAGVISIKDLLCRYGCTLTGISDLRYIRSESPQRAKTMRKTADLKGFFLAKLESAGMLKMVVWPPSQSGPQRHQVNLGWWWWWVGTISWKDVSKERLRLRLQEA